MSLAGRHWYKEKRENRSGTVSRKISMGKRVAGVKGVKGKQFALNRVEPRVMTRLFGDASFLLFGRLLI
jgi:hypothetical protein